MKISKTGQSKYGFYLQLEDGSYKGTTEAVHKFLKDKLPADVDFSETEGEGKNEKVTKVKILGSPSFQKKDSGMTADERKEQRILVDSGNILQRATELTVAVLQKNKDADTIQILGLSVEECIKQFKKIKKSLEDADLN